MAKNTVCRSQNLQFPPPMPLIEQELGSFVNGDLFSNPLKRFLAGGDQLLGFFVNGYAGTNLLKRFSAGGGQQLLGYFVNGDAG